MTTELTDFSKAIQRGLITQAEKAVRDLRRAEFPRLIPKTREGDEEPPNGQALICPWCKTEDVLRNGNLEMRYISGWVTDMDYWDEVSVEDEDVLEVQVLYYHHDEDCHCPGEYDEWTHLECFKCKGPVRVPQGWSIECKTCDG